jgi:hypothetical protein
MKLGGSQSLGNELGRQRAAVAQGAKAFADVAHKLEGEHQVRRDEECRTVSALQRQLVRIGQHGAVQVGCRRGLLRRSPSARRAHPARPWLRVRRSRKSVNDRSHHPPGKSEGPLATHLRRPRWGRHGLFRRTAAEAGSAQTTLRAKAGPIAMPGCPRDDRRPASSVAEWRIASDRGRTPTDNQVLAWEEDR